MTAQGFDRFSFMLDGSGAVTITDKESPFAKLCVPAALLVALARVLSSYGEALTDLNAQSARTREHAVATNGHAAVH